MLINDLTQGLETPSRDMGVLMTTTKQMGNKTLAQLLSLVDWNLQARRPYVVCDPFDPGYLLYLTDKDYQILVRTALSNNESLIVVARPGTVKPANGVTGEGSEGLQG